MFLMDHDLNIFYYDIIPIIIRVFFSAESVKQEKMEVSD